MSRSRARRQCAWCTIDTSERAGARLAGIALSTYIHPTAHDTLVVLSLSLASNSRHGVRGRAGILFVLRGSCRFEQRAPALLHRHAADVQVLSVAHAPYLGVNLCDVVSTRHPAARTSFLPRLPSTHTKHSWVPLPPNTHALPTPRSRAREKQRERQRKSQREECPAFRGARAYRRI